DGTREPLPDIEGPVTSLYQRVLQRGMARFAAIDRALLAAADEPPPPTLNERVRANARRRFAEIDRALLSDPPPPSVNERVRAAARARLAEIDRSLLAEWRRPLDPSASFELTTGMPLQAGGIADA